MGADIYGWVETREPDSDWWDSAIQIHDIVYRQYGMFASLFGVRNGNNSSDTSKRAVEFGRFRAIAPGRGRPPGASQFYAEEFDTYGGGVGESWVLWHELAAIDWNEEGSCTLRPSRLIVCMPSQHRAGGTSGGGTISMAAGRPCSR